jgi:hypothetical protein
MALLKDQTENYIGVWDEEMTKESDRLKEILCMKIKKEFSRDFDYNFCRCKTTYSEKLKINTDFLKPKYTV